MLKQQITPNSVITAVISTGVEIVTEVVSMSDPSVIEVKNPLVIKLDQDTNNIGLGIFSLSAEIGRTIPINRAHIISLSPANPTLGQDYRNVIAKQSE